MTGSRQRPGTGVECGEAKFFNLLNEQLTSELAAINPALRGAARRGSP